MVEIYFTGIEWETDFQDGVKLNACRELHNIDILLKFVTIYALYHKIRIIFQIFVGAFKASGGIKYLNQISTY